MLPERKMIRLRRPFTGTHGEVPPEGSSLGDCRGVARHLPMRPSLVSTTRDVTRTISSVSERHGNLFLLAASPRLSTSPCDLTSVIPEQSHVNACVRYGMRLPMCHLPMR